MDGIDKPCQKYKLKYLEETIHTLEQFVPYFTITESHSKSYHLDAEFAIKDYTPLRADRPVIQRGGVIIYTHNSISWDSTDTYADTICQAAMTYSADIDLILVSIYRPPRACDKSFQKCLKKVEDFIHKHNTADIHMNGDFNMPYLSWADKQINRSNRLTSEINCADNLLNFMNKHLMTQMVTETTRKDKATLDLHITNNSDAIHNIWVEKVEMSDHDMVWSSLLYKKITNANQKFDVEPESPLDRLNLNKADYDSIRSEFNKIDWKQNLEGKDVDEMLEYINHEIFDACTKHAPEKKSKSNKLYIPPKRRSLLKKKKRINSGINVCKYLKPLGHENKLRKLNKKRAEIEIEIRDSIREEKVKKEMDVIKKIKTNPKAFYSYAKKNSKTHTSIGPLIDCFNKLQSHPAAMAEILQSQYTKTFSDPNEGTTDQSQPDNNHVPEFSNISISEDDVVQAINLISANSAPGPDKIPANLLKECKNELAAPLAILWTKSMESSKIPASLLKQTIIPIYKKNNKSLPQNYRPISLTSHIIKIYERILRARLIKHLETNKLISKHQHGFREFRSTLTQLLQHIDSILEILESSGNADILYLDMAKAFDKVSHKILLSKLTNMKVTGKVHAWITEFLTKRSQEVNIEGHKSSPADVISGVPQGTVLGPVLFIIYMNNITYYVTSTIIYMFADDSKLIAKIQNVEDRQKLIIDIQSLLSWTEINAMKFNEDKFQLQQIGSNEQLKQPYNLGNITVTGTEHVRDLGIYISEDLSFKHHITEMIDNATNFSSWLLRTFRSREPEVMLLLLKTYIIPRLEYLSPIWTPHKTGEIEDIESVQRSFTAKIEGLEDYNYHQRLQKLNLYSLQRRRERYVLIHAFKIYLKLAPNDPNLEFHHHPRLGLQCRRKLIKTRVAKIKTLRFNSFSHYAPRLFNVLPAKVKTAKTVAAFKYRLDRLLKHVPDTPPIKGYSKMNNNTLPEWVGSIQSAASQITGDQERDGGELDNSVGHLGMI